MARVVGWQHKVDPGPMTLGSLEIQDPRIAGGKVHEKMEGRRREMLARDAFMARAALFSSPVASSAEAVEATNNAQARTGSAVALLIIGRLWRRNRKTGASRPHFPQHLAIAGHPFAFQLGRHLCVRPDRCI